MKKITWFTTTEHDYWRENAYAPASGPAYSSIQADGRTDQTVIGFGGCFNEMSGYALKKLSEADQNALMDLLFDPQADGLRLNFNRMSIGASDYGCKWYSYNETDGDYAMEHFSIDPDRAYLLPYIKAAYARNPGMKLFGSPWSPPTWMKTPPVYNFGRLTWTEENLRAYALYFRKYIEAYAAEGIHVDQICVQNEMFSDQKFPSCLWNSDQMFEFTTKYLGPLFEEWGTDTEIMLGTLNADEVIYNEFPSRFFHDPVANKYVKGAMFQWNGKYSLPMTHQSFPEKLLIQSENECGNGHNDWGYAKYVYGLFRHYFTNGVSAYVYWNMILETGGMSAWGWHQNSMVTVSEDNTYTLNPEFFVMKHFSRYIQQGAVRLELTGHFTGTSTAFRNPDGSVVVTAYNPFREETVVEFTCDGETYSFALAPDSINTMVIG